MARTSDDGERGGKRGQRELDSFERVGADSFYDGRPSRVSGGERFAAAASTPKPLHWTRIRLIAAAIGAVVVLLALAIATGTAAAAFVGAILGAVVGLVAVTALERAGTFRRVDEL